MAHRTVKQKLGLLNNSRGRVRRHYTWILIFCALLTFILSWLAVFPADLVERWYSRGLFPKISYVAGRFADAAPFSWLDAAIIFGVVFFAAALWKSRLRVFGSAVAVAYLVFFWTWGLNYHRVPLASKIPFDGDRISPQDMAQFARVAAGELNRIHDLVAQNSFDRAEIGGLTSRRVERVVAVVDGQQWCSASRIKRSFFSNTWFRLAGVDGLFNPFGHEPILNTSLLPIEQPFVIAHELAHVRGYPDEGDANFIAALATILSDDPAIQYSGWLHLWLYVRNPEVDSLLNDEPRSDLRKMAERVRSERVEWISNLQAVILDWYLKANSVQEGVRSYSRIAVLAVGTQEHWERFR